MKALILINSKAGNGKALSKWNKIKEKFLKSIPVAEVDEIVFTPEKFPHSIQFSEYKMIFFGGGDGTFHHGINYFLKDYQNRDKVRFGAIGLGSSNDLHRPFKNFIDNIPVRIHPSVTKRDIGTVRISDGNNIQQKFFVLNVGFGITAYGNYLFNNPDRFLKFTKARWPVFSVYYSAFKALLFFQNITVQIDYAGKVRSLLVSSVNITKSEYIAGGLHFDQQTADIDGQLGLHICEDMNKVEILQTLKDLSAGKFSGRKKRQSFFVRSVKISSENIIPMEMDGEIYYGRNFEIDLLPAHINLMQ